ncbi:MAG: hypothetical protein WCF68_16700 [Terriglobales bacterium]
MRLLRRILTTVVITLGVIGLGAFWVAPVALSFNAARKAPPVARVVPTNLKDVSVSQVPGTKVSYVGYEFEIPWNDLDEGQTRSVPKDHPEMVALVFRSGLRLILSASPARVLPMGFAQGMKISPQNVESIFGQGAALSDYGFYKNLYEFTPDKMHLWALFPSVHYREQLLLGVKDVLLAGSSADTGIFNIQNHDWRGFQLGDPQARPSRVAVRLCSDQGSVELTFAGRDGRGPVGVTQPEINRIVQSLHKAPKVEPEPKLTSHN